MAGKALSSHGRIVSGDVLWETSRGSVTATLQGLDTVVRVLNPKGGLSWATTLHAGTPQRVRSAVLAEALEGINDTHVCSCGQSYRHEDWLAQPKPKGGEFQLDDQGNRLQLRVCSCLSVMALHA